MASSMSPSNFKTSSSFTSRLALYRSYIRFYLYEVYTDEAAFQAHLETPHFLTWKGIVEEMFDGELEITPMKTLFPSDDGWRQQKPGLLNW